MNNKLPDKKKQSISLADYWDGIYSALDVRFKMAKEYIKHPITGFSAEEYLRDLLKDYLPKRYTVAPGFVVNSEGDRSDNIDIIIADTMNIPVLCQEPNYKVFAVECVAAVIEVTTGPKSKVKRSNEKLPKLQIDIEKLSKVRSMGRVRHYRDRFPITEGRSITLREIQIPVELCPRAFIVTAGDEWAKPKTYKNHVIEALKNVKRNNSDAFINAAFSFKHGMLHFLPYDPFKTNWYEEHPLLEFLLFINDAILTFDTYKIDVRRYRHTIPKIDD